MDIPKVPQLLQRYRQGMASAEEQRLVDAWSQKQ